MLSEMTSQVDKKLQWLLIFSFAPLLIKALDYAIIDGYVPILVFGFSASFVTLALWRGGAAKRRIIRIWAMGILIWAVARIAIMGLFLFTSVSEAHVESQFTAWYVFVSLAHFVSGILLWRWSK